MKKINILICWVLFFLFIFLLYYCKPQIFPEISVFSYLVKNGFVPYRDFFDHHGFLLYYILAPFIEPNYQKLTIVYFIFQSINFYLVKKILEKHVNEFGIIVGLVLFIILGMFAIANSLWYDSFILTFLLSSVYFNNPILSGFLVGLATLIKPTAGVMILPTIWNKKNWKTSIGFLIPILGAGIYLYTNGALPNALEYLVKYNLFIGSIYSKIANVRYDYLIYCSLITLGILIAYKLNKTKPYLFSYLICSFIFLPPQYDPIHALIFMAFASVIIAKLLEKSYKNKIHLALITLSLGILSLLLLKNAVFLNCQNKWQDQDNILKVSEKITKIKANYKLIVLSDRSDVFVKTQMLLINTFPVYLPFMEIYFKNYSEKIFDAIKKADHLVVVDKSFLLLKRFTLLEDYLITNCTSKISENSFEILYCPRRLI